MLDDGVFSVYYDEGVDDSDYFDSQLATVVNYDHCVEDEMNVDQYDGDDGDAEHDHAMIPLMLVEYELRIEPFFEDFIFFLTVQKLLTNHLSYNSD